MKPKIDQMIEVLRAAQNGEMIQWRFSPDDEWRCTTPDRDGMYNLAWNFSVYEYRTKPKEVTLYVNVYSNGSLFAHKTAASAEAVTKGAGAPIPAVAAVAVPFTFTPASEDIPHANS